MLGGWGSKLEVIQRSQSSYKGLGLVLTLFEPTVPWFTRGGAEGVPQRWGKVPPFRQSIKTRIDMIDRG